MGNAALGNHPNRSLKHESTLHYHCREGDNQTASQVRERQSWKSGLAFNHNKCLSLAPQLLPLITMHSRVRLWRWEHPNSGWELKFQLPFLPYSMPYTMLKPHESGSGDSGPLLSHQYNNCPGYIGYPTTGDHSFDQPPDPP